MYKYRGDERLALPIALWMTEVVKRHYRKHAFSIISFVPAHASRLQERGFNQSELLAKTIGRDLGKPVVPMLEKCFLTATQSKRDRIERLRSLTDSFRLAEGLDPLHYRNKPILLVDDVYTTGSTLRECAKVLRNAGLGSVCSITFAR